MASPVQHIVKWSAQDYRTSRVRMRSIVTRNPMLRLVYLEALNAIWEAGGSIPHDVEVLKDLLAIDAADIAEHLPTLLEIGRKGRGGLRAEHIDGVPVLVNSRALEEIADDIAYRSTQQEFGKKGGRPRKATVTDEQKAGVNEKGTLSDQKGTLSTEKGTPSPPTPLPYPLPPPTPLPEEAPTELARSPAVSTPAPAEPIVFQFPVTGDKEHPLWGLSAAKLAQYVDSFPTLDVEASTRSARQWCLDNPGKLKTAKGMARFLGTWYRDDINRGRNLRAGPRTNGNGSRHERPPDPRRTSGYDPGISPGRAALPEGATIEDYRRLKHRRVPPS